MRTTRWLLPASFLLAIAAFGCGTTAPDDDGSEGTGLVPPTSAPPTAPPTGGGAGTTAAPVDMPMNGTAGTTAVDPMATAGAGGSAPAGVAGSGTVMPGDPPIDTDFPDPRGGCTIDSGFPGDEFCMLPPAPGEGIQIHVGPSDYANPTEVAKFTFAPGNETSQCWSFHTPNTEEVWYQSFALSGRAGTHHIINTMYATDGPDGTTFTACRDPGTGTNPDSIGNLPGASKAYMPRGKIAPENINLGRKIPPNTFAQADMHYFNFTDSPILREFWMNIYTVPKDGITGEATQIRGMGGITWSFLPIQPETRQVFQYQCPINTDGRIIALLGHYHAHGKRFTAFLNDTKVFEMYDYLDPQIFGYDSITTNPPFSATTAGATSGILEVKAGDILKWECDIDNTSANTAAPPAPLRYTNEVRTGEMCNLWGESIGPLINCVL
jgi:hypothetical protein